MRRDSSPRGPFTNRTTCPPSALRLMRLVWSGQRCPLLPTGPPGTVPRPTSQSTRLANATPSDSPPATGRPRSSQADPNRMTSRVIPSRPSPARTTVLLVTPRLSPSLTTELVTSALLVPTHRRHITDATRGATLQHCPARPCDFPARVQDNSLQSSDWSSRVNALPAHLTPRDCATQCHSRLPTPADCSSPITTHQPTSHAVPPRACPRQLTRQLVSSRRSPARHASPKRRNPNDVSSLLFPASPSQAIPPRRLHSPTRGDASQSATRRLNPRDLPTQPGSNPLQASPRDFPTPLGTTLPRPRPAARRHFPSRLVPTRPRSARSGDCPNRPNPNLVTCHDQSAASPPTRLSVPAQPLSQ